NYDVQFGTANPPPQVSTAQTANAFAPGVLVAGTTYFWRIIAYNSAQLRTSGPVWRFTTASAAPGIRPFGGTPAPVPGTIEAENFDLGGQNLAYSDTTPGNTGGVYRVTEDVDIQATTDTGGGYNVGWTKAGEWLKYTVNVAATGRYLLET